MRLLDRMLRSFVRTGSLTVIAPDGRAEVHAGAPGPVVSIRLTDPALYRTLFFNPELKAGEAYMDGTLVVEEGSIRDLLMIFALNRDHLRSQPLQKAVRDTYKRLRKLGSRNTLKRSRSNVAHHYDLSNELYRLFLDDDLHYSCAYFQTPDDTLEAAQQNKLRHIAAKLDLRPGQRILDIGCGWGGMALYLAAVADVEVVGVTLSVEQHALATERAVARGLGDRVRFELKDYRDVQGPFDRIVSIGMFEHVGVSQHQEFFAKVSALLGDGGVALIHTIGRMGGPGSISPWFRKYIFPGAHVPAVSEFSAAAESAKLWITDIEILRRHYAETLKHWEARFRLHRDAAETMFDARFCRMWEFYLIAGEIGFRYGKQMVIQMQLAKAGDALPITRDYLVEAERRLLSAPLR
ncbi:cyclopropane-fatty-acyl-phospholipid synthase family protein [Nevskia sp.]|uniref:SAM-dependent methyltransferase n=1 Tax=Nevskia sp. TaxID=1929292 RepID=UPI0025D44DDF|nr:cyclopropane-fatty-acyl-phospholipid synthase family protein [Nevskia sp.]